MIPFPKMHIAQSALNRIMNTLEGKTGVFNLIEPPNVPDPQLLGLEIDEEATTPPDPAASPDPGAAQAGAIESSLTGGSPFDGALVGSVDASV